MAPDVSDVPPPKVDRDGGAAGCAAFLEDPSDLGEEVSADLQLEEVPLSTEETMDNCCEISPSTKWDGYLSYVIVFIIFMYILQLFYHCFN